MAKKNETTTKKSTKKSTTKKKPTAKKTPAKKVNKAKKEDSPLLSRAGVIDAVNDDTKMKSKGNSIITEDNSKGVENKKEEVISVDSNNIENMLKDIGSKGVTDKAETKTKKSENLHDTSVMISAENVNDFLNELPSAHDTVPAPAQVQAPAVSSVTTFNSKDGQAPATNQRALMATEYGQSLLDAINGDWRMGNWGFVPVTVINEVIGSASDQYQITLDNGEKGACFYIVLSDEEKIRFPQNEKAFIKVS